MFCPKCGKKNDDNSLFCTWCGAGFGSVSTQSLSASPAASAPVEAPATHQELQTVSAAPIVSAENSQAAQSAGEIKQPEPTEQPAYSVPMPGVIPQSSAEHTAAQNSASGVEPVFDEYPGVTRSRIESRIAEIRRDEFPQLAGMKLPH